jgi:hypothetical protein
VYIRSRMRGRLLGAIWVFVMSTLAAFGCGSSAPAGGHDAGGGRGGDATTGSAGAADDASGPSPDASSDLALTEDADGAGASGDASPDAAASGDADATASGDADAGGADADGSAAGGDVGAVAPSVDTAAPSTIQAGAVLVVTCTAVGTSAPTSVVVDTGAGVIRTTGTLLPTRAGTLTVTCTVPSAGLVDPTPATVTVLPALPAALTLSRSPDAMTYSAGDDVVIVAKVFDAFGNACPTATVTHVVSDVLGAGPVTELVAGTFRLGGDGTYRVTYTVQAPTQGGAAVTASVDLLVDDGPSIVCGAPADLATVTATPGTAVAVTGTVSDVNGVSSQVTVDGAPVAVTNGQFAGSVAAAFGPTFFEVSATNSLGLASRRTCTFFAAPRWLDPETANLADAESLKLSQGAVDDSTRGPSLGSLGDITYAIANGSGLASTLDTAFKAANPLKASACDNQVCTFVGCICFYRTGVDYRSIKIDGPNPTSLTLVDGGLQATTHVTGIHLGLRVYGDVSVVPFDTTGLVNVASVDVSSTFDVTLAGGRPHVSVRPNSVSSTTGAVTTDFSGVDGWIINNIVVPLAQGAIAARVRSVVQSFVTSADVAALDGTISSLDVVTPGSSRAVVSLGGAGATTLALGATFTSLGVTPSRALFGVGLRLSAAAKHARPPNLVALPAGVALGDAPLAAPATASLATHVGYLEQSLHALWRGGHFQATVSLASGATVGLDAFLPPVVELDPPAAPTRLKVSFGGLALTVNDGGLPANLKVRVGGRVKLAVALVGAGWKASGPAVAEAHVDVDGARLTTAQAALLDQRVSELLSLVARETIDGAFGTLPVLAFTLPASLAPYGLTAGASLGVTSPTLNLGPTHVVEVGPFGTR